MSNKKRWNNIFKSLFLYFVIELLKLFNNIMLKPRSRNRGLSTAPQDVH